MFNFRLKQQNYCIHRRISNKNRYAAIFNLYSDFFFKKGVMKLIFIKWRWKVILLYILVNIGETLEWLIIWYDSFIDHIFYIIAWVSLCFWLDQVIFLASVLLDFSRSADHPLIDSIEYIYYVKSLTYKRFRCVFINKLASLFILYEHFFV